MKVTSMKSVIRSFGSAALVTATAAVTLAALTPAYASTGSAFVGCNTAGDVGGTGITWSPTILWPPNHKLVYVTISYVDNTDPSEGNGIHVKVLSITSSQGSPSTGVGNHGDAIEGAAAVTAVGLTAERDGNDKAGNVYTIVVQCQEDQAKTFEGGVETGTATLTVIVPHDMGP
jgi:hypothetical protein